MTEQADAPTARRDAVLLAVLPDVQFDGLSEAVLDRAVAAAGESPDLFERGLADLLEHFADWADRQMVTQLKGKDLESLKVRARVTAAVRARFEILEPYKEAVRHVVGSTMLPRFAAAAARATWSTADAVWRVAGDTSTDFNYYSKRGLLTAVLSATTLAWLNDRSEDHAETWAFLDRRIADALSVGGRLGRAKRLGALAEAPFRLAARLQGLARRKAA